MNLRLYYYFMTSLRSCIDDNLVDDSTAFFNGNDISYLESHASIF